MTRRDRKSLGQVADAVLSAVDKEQLAKTAALAHTSSVSVKSELGKLLVKTAASVREEAGREIRYTDLEQFRKNYVG